MGGEGAPIVGRVEVPGGGSAARERSERLRVRRNLPLTPAATARCQTALNPALQEGRLTGGADGVR